MAKRAVMVDVLMRATPTAPLSNPLSWYGRLSDAEAWTLVSKLKAVLGAERGGDFNHEAVSQDDEERERKRAAGWPNGEGKAHARSDAKLGA